MTRKEGTNNEILACPSRLGKKEREKVEVEEEGRKKESDLSRESLALLVSPQTVIALIGRQLAHLLHLLYLVECSEQQSNSGLSATAKHSSNKDHSFTSLTHTHTISSQLKSFRTICNAFYQTLPVTSRGKRERKSKLEATCNR